MTGFRPIFRLIGCVALAACGNAPTTRAPEEHSAAATPPTKHVASVHDWTRFGWELLVYLALGTAGITLIKSIVDLVTVILKARSNGIQQGDHPTAPLEVVVRRSVTADRVDDEMIIRMGHADVD